jgi:hypothetical protein
MVSGLVILVNDKNMPGVGSDSKFLVRVAGLPSSMSRIYLTTRCEEFGVEIAGVGNRRALEVRD